MTHLQMWYFKIKYSHAYIRFQYGMLDLVLHSTGIGMHVVSYSTFCSKREPVMEFTVTTDEASYEAFVASAFDKTGTPYGSKQMFFAGLARVFKWKKNPFGNEIETFCSKTVGTKLEKYFHVDLPGDSNLWVPMDLCEYLKKTGYAKRDF